MHNLFLNYYDNPSGKYLEGLGFSTCQSLFFKFQRYKYQSYLLLKILFKTCNLHIQNHCKLHCACVRTCTCTHTHAFTRVHMHVHMRGYVHVWEAVGQPLVSVLGTPSTYGPASGISPQDSILLVLEIQFFLAGNSQIHLGWAMSLRDPPISTFPCCGYKCLLLHLSSCTDVRDGTQIFMPTCTSPTDLSPHTNAHSFCNLHRILHSLTTQRLVLREQVQ